MFAYDRNVLDVTEHFANPTTQSIAGTTPQHQQQQQQNRSLLGVWTTQDLMDAVLDVDLLQKPADSSPFDSVHHKPPTSAFRTASQHIVSRPTRNGSGGSNGNNISGGDLEEPVSFFLNQKKS